MVRGPDAPFPRGENIWAALRARAAAWSEREAVADAAGGKFDYNGLIAAAEAMAYALHGMGLRPGMRIAWQYEPRALHIAAMLAVVARGCVLVPLDGSHPLPRREAVLSLARCSFGIGSGAEGAPVSPVSPGTPEGRPPAPGGLEWWTPEMLLEAGRGGTEDELPGVPGGQHPWSLLFTSGTTGRPKGVLLPHDGILRLSCAGNIFEPGPGDVFLCLSSPAFDAFALETLLPLLNGAKTVLFPRESLSTPAGLSRTMGASGVNCLWLTAGLFHFLAEDPTIFRPLRLLMTGGDTVRPDIARAVLEACPGLTLVNGYGPTENSVFTTAHHIRPGSLPESGRVPLGRPLAHTAVHILEPDTLTPVRPGEWGEMCCSGPGVGLGYIEADGNPGNGSGGEKRAAFGEITEEGKTVRLYRSGDLVRKRADGLLEFGGRRDDQVKIRGHRLELGDVEAAIRACPGVGEVCVLALPGAAAGLPTGPSKDQSSDPANDPAGGEKLLTAFVSGRKGRCSPARLRRHLAARAPAFMLPARWIMLDDFPLNANGKIDRGRLAAMAVERDSGKRASGRGAAAVLRNMMLRVLGLAEGARFSVSSDFFRAGGDSLRAMRFLAQVERRFGTGFTLAEFMDAPTAHALSGALALRESEAPAPKEPGASDSLPLTAAQRPFWILQRIFPESPVYNVPLLLEFHEEPDLDALWRSLRDLAARNDVLRAVFAGTADGIRQSFPDGALPEGLDEPTLIDCSGAPGRAMRLIDREAARPFAVGLLPGAMSAPLCRVSLYRDGGRHFLLLTLFHGLIDHSGCALLVNDLAGLYAHHACGGLLPPAPGSFAAAVSREAARAATAETLRAGAENLEWWARHLAGSGTGNSSGEGTGAGKGWDEPFTVPPDRPRPAIPDFRGGTVRFRLGSGDAKALRRLARREGVSLFVSLLSLWGLFVRRCGGGGRNAPVLGVPTVSRDSFEAQRTAGLFLRTLPLRLPLDGEGSFAELLRKTGELWREALAHADVEVDTLAVRLRGESVVSAKESRAHDPLFRVLVTLTPELKAPFLIRTSARALSPGSKFDISALFTDTGDGIDCVIEYRKDLYSACRIEHLAASFATLAHDAVTRPNARRGSLNILSGRDRRSLAAFNATGGVHAALLPRRVLDVARARPAAVAVEGGSASLSFAELHHRAERVARLLRDGAGKGAGEGPGADSGSGRFVGLLLERSADNLVAVHAAHKAGLAFIPLDPALPDKRLEGMIADAAPFMPVLLVAAARQETAEVLVGGLETGNRPRIVVFPEENLSAGSLARGGACTDPFPGPFPGLFPDPAPFDPAYALFTSGSTGRPKCAVNSHRGLANRIAWMQRAFPLGPEDLILHKTPLSFDVHVWELFWWSWAGCRVAVLEAGGEKDPDLLCRAVARHGATTIHFVPSMLHSLLFWLEQTGRQKDLASLRRIFVSGEALERPLAERCLRILPWAELHNLYGPTEAAIDVTWEPCVPRTVALESGPIPIGRPVDNTKVHIVAESEPRLQPVGVPGEICLAGAQVGLGYLGRPELSRAAFVPDPFTPAKLSGPDGRMYRTGDRGRFLPDGRIEYLGRMAGDTQVKIRGQRIELGEIESVLQEYPGIARAVAGPVNGAGEYAKSPAESEALAAWIMVEEGFAAAGLAEFLRSRLPGAMVPGRLISVTEFPLSPNGKLARASLSLRLGEECGGGEASRSDADSDVISGAERGAGPEIQPDSGPGSGRDRTAARLRELWAEVLPPAAGAPHDDRGFFDAGGDSLSVIRLHGLMERDWPGLFSVPDLFRFATIRAQAGVIAGKTAGGNSGLAPESGPVPAGGRRASRADRENASFPVAVIGMAVRLADYADLLSFRDDVLRGGTHIGAPPASRLEEAGLLLELQGLPPGGPWAPAGYLDEASAFACKTFRLSPMDALLMDPSQRLFLRTAKACLDRAGGRRLPGGFGRVGVFATGGRDPHYLAALAAAYPGQQERIFALNVPSNTATRLGYLLDWKGPAMVVDTACSSGLAAVHLACRSLRDGECELALVGGGTVITDPRRRHLPILSPSGAVRSYDRDADGTCGGEGGVVFLLKALDAALRDGNPVHAVLRGSAMNQGGAATGMTAPNPEAQAEVIAAAAIDAGVSLASLGYIEGHGTGTRLGDPVELAGLRLAFERAGLTRTDRADFPEQRPGLGSAKAAFGHLDSPAGLLGLARAIVAVREGCILPQPMFQAFPPEIDEGSLPVRVSAERLPWPVRESLGETGGETRRAGVSAFGLSGVNCHVIVEAPAGIPADWAKAGEMDPLFPESPVRRCWPEGSERGAARTPGKKELFAPRRITAQGVLLPVPLHVPEFWPAAEHLLEGEPVLAGMAVPELFRRAVGLDAGSAFHVQGLIWHRPLAPGAVVPDSCHVRYVHPRLSLEGLVIIDGREEWTVFAEAELCTEPSAPPEPVPCESRHSAGFPAPSSGQEDDRTGFRESGQRGVSVSSRWDCLASLPAASPSAGGATVSALLRLPPDGPDQDFSLHPGLLDCAASLGVDASPGEGKAPLVPAGCGSVSVYGPLPDSCLAVFTPLRRERDLLTGDLLLAGLDGTPALAMRRLVFRRVAALPGGLEYHEPGWRRFEPPVGGQSLPRCLFWGEDTPGGQLAALAALGNAPLLRADVSPRHVAERLFEPGPKLGPELLVVRLQPTEGGMLLLAELIRALHAARMDPQRPLRLVCLGYGGDLDAPSGAGWALQQGLLAGAGLESEGLSCSWLDLHPETPPGVVAELLSVGQGNVAVRMEPGLQPGSGTAIRHVFRPVLRPLSPAGQAEPLFTEQGVFIVSGGMGGAGLLLAEAALAAGGRAVLLHRGPPPGDSPESAARLDLFRRLEREHPGRLLPILTSLGSRRELGGALEEARRAFGPPSGIIHAAGIAGDGFLVTRDEEALRGILAPKVLGARLLHELSAGVALDHFILLSSVDSLAPSPGQAAYVAANAWLNAFARWRHGLGLPALAVALPPVSGLGMAARHGLPGAVRPEKLAEIVTTAHGLGAAVVAVAPPGYFTDPLPAGPGNTAARAGSGPGSARFAAVADVSVTAPGETSAQTFARTSGEPAAPVTLSGRSDGGYTDTERAVASIWAGQLGESAFSVHDGFTALGGDSLTGMKVVNQINARLGSSLTLIDLLAEESLASLAAKVDGAGPPSQGEDVRAKGEVFGQNGALPLALNGRTRLRATETQRDIWSSDVNQRAGTAYNLPMYFACARDVDPARLQRALDALMAGRQNLRLAFHEEEGGEEGALFMDLLDPSLPEASFPLERMAWRFESIAERDEFLGSLVRPFALNAFPLCRAVLLEVRIGDAGPETFFFLDVHHIVADGMSMETLCADLAELYDTADMPAEPEGMASYAAWRERGGLSAIHTRELAAALRARQAGDEEADGVVPRTELPEERRRPPQYTFAGAVHTLHVPEALLREARARARFCGVTTASFMLALWALVIQRHTGGRRVCLTLGDSGRHLPGMERIAGQFVANLPMILDPSDRSLESFARSAQEEMLGSMGFWLSSLGGLSRALDMPFNPARAGLMNIGFSYMNYGKFVPSPGSGLGLIPLAIKPKHSAKADLIIFSSEQPDSLVIDLEYYSGAFGESLIRQLAEHFLSVLRRVALLDGRGMPALETDSQPAGERDALARWGQGTCAGGNETGLWTGESAPDTGTLHLAEVLRRHAASRPRAPALEDASGSFDYAGLWRAVRHVAARLADAGVEAGTPVLLDLPRSAREKIMHAAVLLCGGVCVPLDRRMPERRKHGMLRKLAEFSGGAAVHLVSGHSGELPVPLADGLVVHDAAALLPGAPQTATEERGPMEPLEPVESMEPARIPEGGEAPAYILFTSGSTGEPKGIVMPHRSVANLMRAIATPPVPADRVLQTASPVFDAAVCELWETWGAGAALVVPEEEDVLEPGRLAEQIRQRGISYLFLTSSLFGLLARTFPEACAGVRVLLTAGETADPEAFSRILDACPGITLVNCYGPAEAGVRTTLHVVTREDIRNASAFGIPIGRPVPGVRLAVLDEHGRLCPPWCWGELAISGPCLALGYLGQPDLSERVFRPLRPGLTSMASKAGTGDAVPWFHTGDLVRWRPLPGVGGDAVLEIRGRMDSQIKIRGWRVEPAAVERALLAFPGVRGAAVVVEESENGKQLVACLELESGAQPGTAGEGRNAAAFSLAALRAALGAELSSPQLPARYLALPAGERLPMTATGKVDRAAVLGRLSGLLPLAEEEDFAEARSEAERLVAGVFATILGLPRAGRNDNFFSLGGHSLLAGKVRNRLADETGVPLTLGDIFRHPTVAELARHLESAAGDEAPAREIPQRGASPSPRTDAGTDTDDGPHPCTRAQARLYLESCLDDTGMAFTMPTLLELDPGLDIPALEKTLAGLARRHESLRSAFVLSGGEPCQVVVPSLEPELLYGDMRGAGGGRGAALAALDATLRRPFQLDRAPLWRTHVVRLEDSVLFLFCMHHLLADGWAMQLLFDDMRALYAAYSRGDEPSLPPPAGTMREYAVADRARPADSDLAWWRRELEGAPRRIDLPLDREPGAAEAGGNAGASLRRSLTPAEVRALDRAAGEAGGSLSNLLLALFAVLLHRLSGQDEMVVGLGTAGRDGLESEGLVGFLMNIVPLRLRLDAIEGQGTGDLACDLAGFLPGLLAAVRGAMLDALDHQGAPFDELVRRVSGGAARREALFNVAFEYQHFELSLGEGFLSGPAASSPSADLEAIIDTPTSKNDLTLFATHLHGGLHLRMEFKTGILDRESVNSWLDHYLDFIREVIAEHEEPV